MSNRITEKMLEARVEWLNNLMDRPTESYTRIEGKLTANLGNYHISHAYGGVSLHEMCTEGGGVNDVFSSGHVPKRELFDKLCAYMDGIEAERRHRKAQS